MLSNKNRKNIEIAAKGRNLPTLREALNMDLLLVLHFLPGFFQG